MDYEEEHTFKKKLEIEENRKRIEENKNFFKDDMELELNYKLKEQNIKLERFQLNMIKHSQTEL